MRIFKTTKECLKCKQVLFLKTSLKPSVHSESDEHFIVWGKYFCKNCNYRRKVLTHFLEEERDSECISKGI